MKKMLCNIKPITLSILLFLCVGCQTQIGFVSADSETITFSFSDYSIAASNSSDSYIIEGTKLTILGAGNYLVTGNCSNGSITIKKATTGVVLVLKSLELSCDYSAPILCEEGSDVNLVLSETSTLTDDKSKVEDETAVIKADKNSVLTIKGDGSLNVKAANNGIASDGSIVISGGNVNVEAGNNGIESDPDYCLGDIMGGTLTITDGEITINAEDAAIKAASMLTIGIKGKSSGPDINVIRSGDGLKAAQIYLYSGKGIIRSSDDGINAAYKRFTSTDEADGGYQYADDLYRAFREKFGDFLIEVDGGTWYVNADGDGLDSNGGIKINGGNITVFGSEGNDDAAIDYENIFEINEGQIIAIGTSNMAVYPTKTQEAKSYVVFGAKGIVPPSPDDGPEPSVPDDGPGQDEPVEPEEYGVVVVNGVKDQMSSSLSIKRGDKIVIKDSENNVVASATAEKTANNVMYALTDGDKTYKLYINGVEFSERID